MVDAEWFLQGHSHEGYRPAVTEKQQLLKDVRKLQAKIERKQYEVNRIIEDKNALIRRLAEFSSNTDEEHYV